jgi:hypothetical protein
MKNKLIIVIHIIDKLRTLEQVKIAFDNNADGIFLTIGEAGISVKTLLDCYHQTRTVYKKEFIGINFMCDPKTAANSIPIDANALWIDKGLGYINYIDDIVNVKNILKERQWKGLYFGGFCLKGNNQKLFDSINYFKKQEWNPQNYFDVCVTSGISTGIPITIENLEIVIEKSKKCPIALASGVNINNIHTYLDKGIEYFIVGTGVEKDSDDLNIINFYKEAGLPNPVNIGCLDSNKIKQFINILQHFQSKIF